jgi:hypothetical protein
LFGGFPTVPYSSISEARIKKLDGVSLTLSQINAITRMADAIGGDKGWPIAISNFKKSHKISNDSWVEDSEKEKELSNAYITKQDNGKFKITAVSTAALKDRDGETYTTEAIDYDIMLSKETKQYPEFRVFHCKYLGIGKVQKMSRVGIFAIDEGESYDDAFSLDVCNKMLTNNTDGKWRVSRGFLVLEASGICPDCGEGLLIRAKHMKVGFRCPTCKAIQLGNQGSLSNLRFLKTKTLDVTITDTPAVPWTGASAIPVDLSHMEVTMDKKVLKERLLKAGIEESLIDDRLNALTPDMLKEFDDIPEAMILKEFQADHEDGKDSEDLDENTFTLDPAVLKEFGKIVDDVVSSRLEGLQIEVEESEEKEVPDLVELKESVQAMKESIEEIKKLLTGTRTKETDEEDIPRTSRLKVLRTKAVHPSDDEEDPESDEEGNEPKGKSKGKMPFKKDKDKEYDDGVAIMASDGTKFDSMTSLVTSGGKDG